MAQGSEDAGRAKPCRGWKTMLTELTFRILKAKGNRGVMYLNLCVKDCGGSEILCYLQAYKLICHKLTDADRRRRTPG